MSHHKDFFFENSSNSPKNYDSSSTKLIFNRPDFFDVILQFKVCDSPISSDGRQYVQRFVISDPENAYILIFFAEDY